MLLLNEIVSSLGQKRRDWTNSVIVLHALRRGTQQLKQTTKSIDNSSHETEIRLQSTSP